MSQTYIFRKDLQDQDISNWPQWLLDAHLIDPVVHVMENDKVIWKDGIWLDGYWDGHWWENGLFFRGIWNGGTWEDGIWYDGVANKMCWNKGIWNKGIFNYGTFDGGLWKNGNFYAETFKNAIWENGFMPSGHKVPKSYLDANSNQILQRKDWPIWLKQANISWAKISKTIDDKIVWHDGEWLGGIWKNGIWRSGIWKGGKWMNGIWLSGEWNFGHWMNGKFKCGNWFDGVWYDGRFEGNWHSGAHLRLPTSVGYNQYNSLLQSIITRLNISNIDELRTCFTNILNQNKEIITYA